MRILLILLTLIGLSACGAPAVIIGTGAVVGATLSKEKTVGSSIDDSAIWTKIKAAFVQNRNEVEGILTNISVEVSEGRVLLTGIVESSEDRLKILRMVWDQAGVREVINEIKLRESENEIGIKQYATDSWITTQIKSQMIYNRDIRSINFNIETVNGVVYILGVARNEQELELVTNIAENTSHVTKVISYVRVKGQQQNIE